MSRVWAAESSPSSWSTYWPAAEKVAVVEGAAALPKLTEPGPLCLDQSEASTLGG